MWRIFAHITSWPLERLSEFLPSTSFHSWHLFRRFSSVVIQTHLPLTWMWVPYEVNELLFHRAISQMLHDLLFAPNFSLFHLQKTKFLQQFFSSPELDFKHFQHPKWQIISSSKKSNILLNLWYNCMNNISVGLHNVHWKSLDTNTLLLSVH